MKILLLLGDLDSVLTSHLEKFQDNLIVTSEKINEEFINLHLPEFIISYGYRYIIPESIIAHYPDNAVNLHISFLPWNRGADPNFWSFIDDTPKGVTIHYIDRGVDTGDIIVQRRVEFSDNDTLRTSYLKLHQEMLALFKENWTNIRSKKCQRIKQSQFVDGTSHRLKDKEKLAFLLTHGWDTPTTVLKEYAAETRLSEQFWCNP